VGITYFFIQTFMNPYIFALKTLLQGQTAIESIIFNDMWLK